MLSTHQISKIILPTVTVCPPKGSNTALNYDLMRANNISFTEEQRGQLERRMLEMFIKHPT